MELKASRAHRRSCIQGVDRILLKLSKHMFSIKDKTLKLDTEESVASYCSEIKALDVTSIELSGNSFGVEAVKALMNSIGTNLTNVRCADMFTARLKTEIPPALDAMVNVFVNQFNLVNVDLSDNAFGPAGAKPLMRLIVENRSIVTLRLNNNGLGIGGMEMISKALIEAHTLNVELGVKDKLEMIVVGRNRMESEGSAFLAKALKLYADSLIHIQIPQNSIRPEGIANLVEAIQSCHKLQFLDLQDNTFTEIGSKAIQTAFPSWPDLRCLNIGDCLLGKEGGRDVIRGLTGSNHKLETIQLFFNEIDEVGAALVVEMVKGKTGLKKLELNGNAFHGEGKAAEAIRSQLEEDGKEGCLDELDEMEVESDEEQDEDEEDDLVKALEGAQIAHD